MAADLSPVGFSPAKSRATKIQNDSRGQFAPEAELRTQSHPATAKMSTAAAASHTWVRRRSTACLRNCVNS